MTSYGKAFGACVMWVGLLTSLQACHVVHLRRDAPGDVDVLTPPEDLSIEATQVPDDPGEEIRLMTLGVSNMVGSQLDRSGQPLGVSYQLVIEGSLAWYNNPKSPLIKGLSLFPDLIPDEVSERFPETSFTQLNLGVAPLEVVARKARPGPIYMEIQRTIMPDSFMDGNMTAVAAGYAYHASLGSHGPQLTVSFLGNAFSLRGAYFLNQGYSVGLGLNIKIPTVMWVGSQ